MREGVELDSAEVGEMPLGVEVTVMDDARLTRNGEFQGHSFVRAHAQNFRTHTQTTHVSARARISSFSIIFQKTTSRRL